MRGLVQLFATTALAANKAPMQYSSVVSSQSGGLSKPLTVIEEPQLARRKALQTIFLGGAAFVANPAISSALDMDAFMNSELEKDEKNCNPKLDPKCKPEMTKDEALCKYGQSGNARGEACKRFKDQGGKLPTSSGTVKSLGGAYAM